MKIINWGALYYTFGASGKNYKVVQNFRVSLDEKMKSNLKLLKDRILKTNYFLLFNFVFFSFKQRVIFKHLTLALTYVLIKNNLNITTAFLNYETPHN